MVQLHGYIMCTYLNNAFQKFIAKKNVCTNKIKTQYAKQYAEM